jgi:hypothetical protein
MVNIWQIQGEIIFNPVLFVICSKGFTNFPKLQEFSASARRLKGEIYMLGGTLQNIVTRDLCSPDFY